VRLGGDRRGPERGRARAWASAGAGLSGRPLLPELTVAAA